MRRRQWKSHVWGAGATTLGARRKPGVLQKAPGLVSTRARFPILSARAERPWATARTSLSLFLQP